MPAIRNLDQHLQRRAGRWHYVRLVPAKYAEIDQRGMIRTALGTDSLELARARRDALMEADDEYWASLQVADGVVGNSARRRYQAAQKRAMARGFIYSPALEMSASVSLEELLERLGHAQKHADEGQEVEAVLGGVERPKTKFQRLLSFIALSSPSVKSAINRLINRINGSLQKRVRSTISLPYAVISPWIKLLAFMDENSMTGGAQDCFPMGKKSPCKLTARTVT